MENGLHIAGHAGDQVVDLVIADPKGRVLGLYRGANGEIALTASEARFLMEALPAMVARADYLEYMGPLPALDPAEERKEQVRGIEGDSVSNLGHQIGVVEEPAQMPAANPASPTGQGSASSVRPNPKVPPHSRCRGTQRQRPGRSRAGQPWHASEDNALISGYRGGQGIKDLARIHGRSSKAIALRLERLGVSQLPAARAANAPHSVTYHA
jgi:hypothetical protein